METLKIDCNKTKMIAHRGLSGLERENTIASFIAAGNKSYYGMECDIHKTKDGVFVVIHDDDTRRVSNINLVIKDSTYEELSKINLYDVDTKETKNYLKIPTLEEYLNICKKYEKVAIVEFKNRFEPEDIEKVISIINNKNYLNYTTFISFYVENLLHVRKVSSFVKIQLLSSEYTDEIFDLCCKYHFDLDIHHGSVTPELVSKLHLYNIKINCWTVNNPIIALMLISWGIDYMTTDILE